ncbi:B-4DMT family transporter [Nocardia miyunensis]|uniref:B-4DMT family transporter n=1 Tax=Nocardia miyunensis TaxID=282684 RepID=UPI0008325469|nr:B-4DMT family transporter [Nocardia miyunensis]
MIAWVLRAIGLGVLTVVLRTLLGFGMIYWPTQGAWMRLVCLIVLIVAGVAWGLFDGRGDRKANPDPERGGADLTMRWLKAGVVGGLGSGVVAWVLDYIPSFDLGDNGLGFELTAGAAFIVLMIFIPAMVGVALGRFLVTRENNKAAKASAPSSGDHAASPA